MLTESRRSSLTESGLDIAGIERRLSDVAGVPIEVVDVELGFLMSILTVRTPSGACYKLADEDRDDVLVTRRFRHPKRVHITEVV